MVGGEAVVTVAIRELRRALGDQARHPQFIDADRVKVNIRPAHGDLEDIVQKTLMASAHSFRAAGPS
jgi:hypothetical protein